MQDDRNAVSKSVILSLATVTLCLFGVFFAVQVAWIDPNMDRLMARIDGLERDNELMRNRMAAYHGIIKAEIEGLKNAK